MSETTMAVTAAQALKAAQALVAQAENEAQLDQLNQALIESENRFNALVSKWLARDSGGKSMLNFENGGVPLSLTKTASEHAAGIEILRRAVKLQTAACSAGRQSHS
jgi:hypothetical protein